MGEASSSVGDRWRLRSVPEDLAERYRAEGWWTDDTLGDDGGRRARAHGRRRLPGPLAGASLGGHLRRGRPAPPGRWPARLRAPTGSGPATSWCSSSPTGSRPASPSGRPPTSGPSSCPSCTSTAPRRSTTSSARCRRRGRDRRPVRPQRLPGHLRVAAGGPGRRPLAGGRRHARRARSPPAPARSSRRSTATRSSAPSPSIRTGRRSSASRRAPPATRRAWSTRTAPSGSRRASSPTCFPRGGPPQITGAPVGHFIGMLNAFLIPLLRERPVNLIDVWDPGEVLRMMREEGSGCRRWRDLLPHQPARPPGLHRRAPRPDALRRARAAPRCPWP